MPSYIRSQQQLLANLAARAEQLVDARAARAFRRYGGRAAAGPRSGHIPGSRNVPYAELFDAADRHDEAAR